MSLFTLLAVLLVGGVVLYIFNRVITPIDARVKTIINAVVLLVLGLLAMWWVLGFIGFDVGAGPTVPYRHR